MGAKVNELLREDTTHTGDCLTTAIQTRVFYSPFRYAQMICPRHGRCNPLYDPISEQVRDTFPVYVR